MNLAFITKVQSTAPGKKKNVLKDCDVPEQISALNLAVKAPSMKKRK